MSHSSYRASPGSFVLSGSGAHDRVSDITSSFPGRYLTEMRYCCIVMIIFCSRAGAWYNGFFSIAAYDRFRLQH